MSIDGASQDVYSQYRVKGNLDNVINNIKILNGIKAKYKSIFPLVTWKYLTFSHNEHQISQAQFLAKSLNVENFEVFKANPKLKDIYDDADEYRNNEEKRKLLKYQCNSLWQSLYISSNGFVFPCSLAFREKESFGDILNDDLQKTWNNSQYQMARKLFSKEPQIGETPYPCKGCKYSIKASSCFEQ